MDKRRFLRRIEAPTIGANFFKESVAVMPKFKVGDYVEPIGTLVPDHVRQGIILSVIPNKEGLEWATEYEIEFKFGRAKFFERQLRLTKAAPASDRR